MIPEPGVYGYLKGTYATLFAAPPSASGLAFAGWEIAGEHSINPSATFLIDNNIQVCAHFSPIDTFNNIKLDVLSSEGDGVGVLKPLTAGVYYFAKDAIITFSCDLQSDSYFGGFTGDVTGEINYHALPVALKLALVLPEQAAY